MAHRIAWVTFKFTSSVANRFRCSNLLTFLLVDCDYKFVLRVKFTQQDWFMTHVASRTFCLWRLFDRLFMYEAEFQWVKCLSARRYVGEVYAAAVRLSVCLSLCHKSEIYRNWCTVFRTAAFLSSVIRCAIRKFGYLQKEGYFPLGHCPKLQ